MPEQLTAPYGSWKSPISIDIVAGNLLRLQEPRIAGNRIYWLEGRPWEGGRQVLVCRTPEGSPEDLLSSDFNVRTRVHEYGGGSYTVSGESVYFSNYSDQRVYCQAQRGETPQAITPESESKLRYADFELDTRRRRIICVREDHTTDEQEPTNTLVTIDLSDNPDGGTVIASGSSFYSTPRLSPDGTQLAWLAWDHPNLPWDGTELWLADLDDAGEIVDKRKVAGGPNESIFQPEWSPEGTLHFISDRTGWWNIYRLGNDEDEPLYAMQADFGAPQWVFASPTYTFQEAGSIICRYMKDGTAHLARIDRVMRTLEPLGNRYTAVSGLRAQDGHVVFLGGSPTELPSIVRMDTHTLESEVLQCAGDAQIDPGYISVAEAIEYPTEGGLRAHAFFYPPANKDYSAPVGEKPPLIVQSHGGPTSAVSNGLDLTIQYWTSRGIAVVDVNYGGSTGYGREYRERLNGQWGIVDVDDCVNAAKYLVDHNLVDGERLAISGGSAGGFTTLNALTFKDLFHAGASYYGISDLFAMMRDTHKFESRYLDNLVGPYPERKDLYYERSSIHFTDRLSCPLILFQGLEDKVVPPSQSEMMRDALRSAKLPVAYLAFEGEQHGFRKTDTIKRATEAEFYFYSRIFGFSPADKLQPIEIENL